jgi:predicted DNA-binding transcriptional regulator YafY
MRDLLQAAINEHKLVKIWYEPGTRTIECHALGYGSVGQVLLRAFQIDGASSSNEHINWKLFRLDRMRDVELTGVGFDGPRPEYKLNDRAMTRGIICQLSLLHTYTAPAA